MEMKQIWGMYAFNSSLITRCVNNIPNPCSTNEAKSTEIIEMKIVVCVQLHSQCLSMKC